jgi:hypothetical protein
VILVFFDAVGNNGYVKETSADGLWYSSNMMEDIMTLILPKRYLLLSAIASVEL